jgi:hypothetical protein
MIGFLATVIQENSVIFLLQSDSLYNAMQAQFLPLAQLMVT